MEDDVTVVARGSGTTAIAGTEIWLGRARLTPNALFLPHDASEEECEQVIQTVSHVDDAAPWWRGDAILQSEYLHGEKYAQWVDLFRCSEGYLRNLVWVCAIFPPEDRHPGLSYKHHQVVASVKDREARLTLLEEAYRENMTTAALYNHAVGIRLEKGEKRKRGGDRVVLNPTWAEMAGLKGEVITIGDEPWLAYHGGMAKLTPTPLCAVCRSALTYTLAGGNMLVTPCSACLPEG